MAAFVWISQLSANIWDSYLTENRGASCSDPPYKYKAHLRVALIWRRRIMSHYRCSRYLAKKMNYGHQTCQHSGKTPSKQLLDEPLEATSLQSNTAEHFERCTTRSTKQRRNTSDITLKRPVLLLFSCVFSLTCLQWQGITADVGRKSVSLHGRPWERDKKKQKVEGRKDYRKHMCAGRWKDI